MEGIVGEGQDEVSVMMDDQQHNINSTYVLDLEFDGVSFSTDRERPRTF